MYKYFCDDFRLKRFFEYFLGKQFKGIFLFPNSRIMEIKKSQKIPTFFNCSKCDYITVSKKDFNKHCLTSKHKMEINGNNLEIEKSPDHKCECGKLYKSYSGLWKHQHHGKCIFPQNDNLLSKELITPELVMKLIEQNKELTNVIMQQGTTMNKLSNVVTNNTLINNKTFNLNVYLNETCKNAMNIDEFVDNVKVSFDDLEYTGRKGYIEGISNIILKNLKRIKEYDRPIHCSDCKREIVYIKYNNVWNKEDVNKTILTSAIKSIANQNIKQISKWRDANPDCIHSDSKKNNLYLKIVSNSMCGINEEETNKNINKILSNVAKEVVITKKP
jgi:hypothetical protein